MAAVRKEVKGVCPYVHLFIDGGPVGTLTGNIDVVAVVVDRRTT